MFTSMSLSNMFNPLPSDVDWTWPNHFQKKMFYVLIIFLMSLYQRPSIHCLHFKNRNSPKMKAILVIVQRLKFTLLVALQGQVIIRVKWDLQVGNASYYFGRRNLNKTYASLNYSAIHKVTLKQIALPTRQEPTLRPLHTRMSTQHAISSSTALFARSY